MISVSDIRKTYDRHSGSASEVLHGLSFELPDTGFVCITGASGSGKTTLLNVTGGLDRFDSGTVNVDGTALSSRSRRAFDRVRNDSFGYIFQNYYLLSDHSAAYNVYIGLHSLSLSRKEKLSRVREALAKVGMERYYRKKVGELSGGQQQRVAIARAVARRPRVIFADEPTGNLDRANTMNICSLLKELSADSLVLMVTHEESIARFYADRIIRIEDGNIVADDSSWEDTSLAGGDQNTVYSGDYTETSAGSESLSVRVLSAQAAAPCSITVVVEKDRILIKSDDSRIIMCSAMNTAPYIEEGKRPVLERRSSEAEAYEAAEGTESAGSAADPGIAETDPDASAAPPLSGGVNDAEREAGRSGKARRHGGGLEPGLLLREALGGRSGRKLLGIGVKLFLILLSFMLCLTVSDVLTLSRIEPEDFIRCDSHVISLSFSRGEGMTDKYDWMVNERVARYYDLLLGAGFDIVPLPEVSGTLAYRDDTIPQYGTAEMKIRNFSFVPLDRLDPDTLILGRMPERYDEIVIDRWVLDKALSNFGVVENIIPNYGYLLGKRLIIEKKYYSPVITGICDSGEPSIYMDPQGIYAFGNSGDNIIKFSEYTSITGDLSRPAPAAGECYTVPFNTGASYMYYPGTDYVTKSRVQLPIADFLTITEEDGLSAWAVVSDETFDELYLSMICDAKLGSLWCADKEAVLEFLGKDGIPDEFEEKMNNELTVRVTDRYSESYDNYTASVRQKLNARFIVTAALALISVVMLYLMQRSRISERLGLIAVYRLLGIPKRDALTVFMAESLTQSVLYSLPAVLLTYAGIRLLEVSGMNTALSLPFPAAAAVFGGIALIRLIFAALPAMRLMDMPPAVLTSKYDI